MRESKGSQSGSALVVGAGIGGMGSALLLAEMGYRVYLLDSAPYIGGSLHLLDRTFPTPLTWLRPSANCGICFVAPEQPNYCPSIACDLHPLIEILPYCELEGLDGEAGAFIVSILNKPRYVLVEKCDGCGLCAEVCPAERPSHYFGELYKEKAIYRPPWRAIPSSFVIDGDYCTWCGECVKVCPTEAIDLEMKESSSQIEVGAIILSPGFRPFDAFLKAEYGFGRYPNVLTGVQFERMLSISIGLPKRPSDGKPPRSIAFIQCVGSRDVSLNRGYCSSVCCMYATKQALVAKERLKDIKATILCMDIRAHGKGFERYIEGAKGQGVRYLRCGVSSVREIPRTHNLSIKYETEGGQLSEEEFDLVVLSTGLDPPIGSEELASHLGIELDDYGFCETRYFSPNETNRSGIFVAGAFRKPMDITDTVIDAASAAAKAALLLKRHRKASEDRPLPQERDVVEEEPRLGVFVCACGREIADVVDIDEVKAYAEGLMGVAIAKGVSYACSPDGLAYIKEVALAEKLNRIVVAACSLRLYGAEFESVMRESGLNPYLLERADIREGCAWVHRDRDAATAKAKSLVGMAIAKALFHKPVKPSFITPITSALVIGGGLAGMTAALSLAGMGYSVDLVERGKELGGNLRRLRYTLGGENPRELLNSLVKRVEEEPLIRLHLEAEVKKLKGTKGNYLTTISLPDGREESLRHGAIIVATGAREAETEEYIYGKDARVLTQFELEEMIARMERGEWRGENGEGRNISTLNSQLSSHLSSVVMIQCVGSREGERPYCSRVCCSQAVKNALKIREISPSTQVFILYREMRTYGLLESYYQKAREEGVIFIRYDLPDKPRVVKGESGLKVEVNETLLGERLVIEADLVVLSTGIAPNDNRDLADVLGVPLDEDGFFQEADIKVLPMDFAKQGVFLCGLAHSPRSIEETISQANGAAMRAAVLLSRARVEDKGIIVTVNPRLCGYCGVCVSVCPYEARFLDEVERVAKVIDVLCQGCGACVSACPNGATQQKSFEEKQMLAMIDAAI
jgi:heterodisulfide reductase subunit A